MYFPRKLNALRFIMPEWLSPMCEPRSRNRLMTNSNGVTILNN